MGDRRNNVIGECRRPLSSIPHRRRSRCQGPSEDTMFEAPGASLGAGVRPCGILVCAPLSLSGCIAFHEAAGAPVAVVFSICLRISSATSSISVGARTSTPMR